MSKVQCVTLPETDDASTRDVTTRVLSTTGHCNGRIVIYNNYTSKFQNSASHPKGNSHTACNL